MSEDRLGAGEDRGPVGFQGVECAGTGEAFELPAVEQPGVDASGKVFKGREWPRSLPLLDQRLHRLLANARPLAADDQIAGRHPHRDDDDNDQRDAIGVNRSHSRKALYSAAWAASGRASAINSPMWASM